MTALSVSKNFQHYDLLSRLLYEPPTHVTTVRANPHDLDAAPAHPAHRRGASYRGPALPQSHVASAVLRLLHHLAHPPAGVRVRRSGRRPWLPPILNIMPHVTEHLDRT